MVYNESDIKRVVAEVVGKYLNNSESPIKTEVKNDILLEVSARHVHLTDDALKILFGEGATLAKKRMLSQPGEFASEQRVKLVTAKGVIDNVAVLGPTRKAVQVELSATDCRQLGIKAPVNLSGDLTGAGNVILVTEKGVFEAKNSVIIARAHIHLTPKDAYARKLKNGQTVSVKIKSKRPVTLNGVEVRVNENFAEACHIDFDEANAALVEDGTKAEIVY